MQTIAKDFLHLVVRFLLVVMLLCWFLGASVTVFAQEAEEQAESTEETVPVLTPNAKSSTTKPISQPIDLKPVQAIASKTVNIPLPPDKPAALRALQPVKQTPELVNAPLPRGLLNAPAVAPVPETDVEEDASSSKPSNALIDPSIPLPPLKPQFDFPVPPSMKAPNPNEKEEEGEEEGASAGVEKQVGSVEIACIKSEVMDIVKKAGGFFHAVPVITSGYRSRGRRGSLHRRCMAVDFMIVGVSTQTLATYLRSLPEAGGVGTYCHTKAVHIDVGEPRNWGYCGFRRTYFSMR